MYTFHDSEINLRVFYATYKNEFFMGSSSSHISMGAGGNAGLYVDDDLMRGHSDKSETYNNEILCSDEFFQLLNIEVWELA